MSGACRYIVVSAMLIAASALATETDPFSSLRAYVVRPAVHGYLFTGVVSGSGPTAHCAFNHLSGKTDFVRVGGMLGEDRLIRHEPQFKRVPDATLGIERDVSISRAVFQRPDGGEFTLTENEPLEQQTGRMACLVDLTSGWFQYVMAGDEILTPGGTVTVQTVSEHSVAGSAAGASVQFAVASDEERAAVLALWQSRRDAQTARIAASRAAQEAEDAAQTDWMASIPPSTPPRLSSTRQSSLGMGTIYSFPVEYDVLPVAVRGPNGCWISSGVVVPTRFETRMNGVGIRVR